MLGYADVVLTLRKFGAEVNTESDDGDTALVFAVKDLWLHPNSEFDFWC
jgi:hypothetical protein